jgi:DNA-binding NarL/FixJ family response regulator
MSIEHPGPRSNLPYRLTPREFQVLDGMARGECGKMTANRLNISLSTQRCLASHVYRKMKVSSALQAVVKAFRERLVEVEP